MQEIQEQKIDLRGIFKIIRKRLVLILFSALIVTTLGSIYTFFIASPVYTASTQLVVKLPDSDDSGAYAGQVAGNIQMANTINQVIVSPVILDKVQSNLNLSDDSFQKQVTAANLTNSQVITLTVKYSNPYVAQKIADETANIFSMEAANLLNVTNVNILSKAKAQTTPISPKPKLYLAISVIAGLVLGLAIALLKELFDNKINKEEDIETLGLTVLGVTTYAQMSDFNKNTNKNGTQSGTKSSPPSDHEVNRSLKRNKR